MRHEGLNEDTSAFSALEPLAFPHAPCLIPHAPPTMRPLLHRFLPDTLLARSVFGGTVEQWLMLALALAAAALLLAGFRRLVAWRVRAVHAGTSRVGRTVWAGRLFTDALNRTRGYFLFAVALFVAARLVGWNAEGLRATTWLLTVAAIFQAGRWASGVLTLYLDRYAATHIERDASAVTTMNAVGVLARFVLWAVVALTLLAHVGINVTGLVAGLGIGGIAIGLAVQNILSDLFASLSIVLDKPFVIGDLLAVGPDVGTVEHIGLKSTRIRSLSGEQIVFSNGDLLGSRVRNYQRMDRRRVVFAFGLTYATRPDAVEALPGLVREIIAAVPQATFDRCHFKAFGASSLDFEAVYYVESPVYDVFMDVQQAVGVAVLRAFAERDLDFAFPTQTLHLASVPAETQRGEAHSAEAPADLISAS